MSQEGSFFLVTAAVALAVPVVVGMLTPPLWAQSPVVPADRPVFDVASIKPNKANNLEDRFKLKLHRETKVSSVYALVVAKDGDEIYRAVG